MAAPRSAQPPLPSDAARRQRKRRRSPSPPRRRRSSRDGAELWRAPLSLPASERGGRGAAGSPAAGPRSPPEGSDWRGSPPRDVRRGRPTSPQRPPGNPVRKCQNRWGNRQRTPPEGWARSPGAAGLRGDRWSSPERRGSQQRSLSSPSRKRPPGQGGTARMRKRRSPGSDRRGWGSPKREARQESPEDWGQSPADLRRNRWSSPEKRGSEAPQQPLGGRHTQPGSPKGARSLESPSSRSRAWSDADWERRQECPPSWKHPSREPFQGDPGGGRWNGPERKGGEQRPPPRRRQVGPGSLERPPRKKPGTSRDPQGCSNPEQESSQKCLRSRRPPAGERFWESPGGGWSSPEGRGGDHESPAREERGWGDPARHRRQKSMPGEERAWGSPKQGAEWESSGSFSSQSQLDSDQGLRSWGGSRQSSRGQRGAGAKLLGRGESPRSSDRQPRSIRSQQNWSRPTFSRGGWNPEEGQAETESRGRGGRGSDSDGEEGSARRSISPAEIAASTPAARLERWTPREQLVQYWMQCRAVLRNRTREQLMSFCPRPTLPDRTSEAPVLNKDIKCMLNTQQVKELKSASWPLRVLHEEVLDMLAPAMTIYEMAEEAMERGESVDPVELREWSRRLICFIGSISHRLTLQRRTQVLGIINPRLKTVTCKMASHCTEGKLFAEDKVKLLKEILKRFPQLREYQNKVAPRKYQLAARRVQTVAARQRRPPLGPHSRPTDHAARSHGQSPASRRGNQDHR